MKALRRWTTSIVSSFESIVGQLENHDALITEAIREVQRSAARARTQLNRVRHDGIEMRKRIGSYDQQCAAWRERAKRIGSTDQAKAIECLKRAKSLAARQSELEEQERQHASLERQLAQELTVIDGKLSTLKNQRNLMRTRQSKAEALRALQQVDTGAVGEIDSIFERWEERIATYEGVVELYAPSEEDTLEAEFVSVEEAEELRAELETLLK